MVRYGPCPAVRGGEIRSAAPKLHLACAVRIHVEHIPRIIVGRVGVLPAEVDHAPVVVHARVPVAVLLERKLADGLGPGVDLVEVHHRLSAVFAGQALHAGGRRGYDAVLLRQVARIEPVHVVLVAGGKLAQPLAVDPNLQDGPLLVGPAAGEHQAFGVPVKLHVLDDRASGMTEQRLDVHLAAQVRQYGNFVVPAGRSRFLFAFPATPSPAAPRIDRRGGVRVEVAVGLALATDNQQLVAVQQWVGQQRLAGELRQSLRVGLAALEQIPQAPHILCALVPGAVGLAEILDRPHQRLGCVDWDIAVVYRPERRSGDHNC